MFANSIGYKSNYIAENTTRWRYEHSVSAMHDNIDLSTLYIINRYSPILIITWMQDISIAIKYDSIQTIAQPLWQTDRHTELHGLKTQWRHAVWSLLCLVVDMASNIAVSDLQGARALGISSYVMSVVGIVTTVIIVAVTVAVIMDVAWITDTDLSSTST